MNPIRKFLLRWQSHEILKVLRTVIFALACFGLALYLMSERANAMAKFQHTFIQLSKMQQEFSKINNQYNTCLQGGVVGRDRNGVALVCVAAMEIKLL